MGLSNTYNEYQVDHMPESVNRTGIGFADFVLTGKDVEASGCN